MRTKYDSRIRKRDGYALRSAAAEIAFPITGSRRPFSVRDRSYSRSVAPSKNIKSSVPKANETTMSSTWPTNSAPPIKFPF
jgi:hypothetical protein